MRFFLDKVFADLFSFGFVAPATVSAQVIRLARFWWWTFVGGIFIPFISLVKEVLLLTVVLPVCVTVQLIL